MGHGHARARAHARSCCPGEKASSRRKYFETDDRALHATAADKDNAGHTYDQLKADMDDTLPREVLTSVLACKVQELFGWDRDNKLRGMQGNYQHDRVLPQARTPHMLAPQPPHAHAHHTCTHAAPYMHAHHTCTHATHVRTLRMHARHSPHTSPLALAHALATATATFTAATTAAPCPRTPHAPNAPTSLSLPHATGSSAPTTYIAAR